jgi:molecular chaperone GrpE
MNQNVNTEEQNINGNSTDTSEAADGSVNGADKTAAGSTAERTAQQTAKDPLTELQEKCDMLNDKYLRLYSEFENYRRRTAKEKLDTVRHAGSQIFKELLPVLDDFDRAVAANENDNDIESIKEGFKLIHHKLQHILETNGVKAMDVMEKPFDTSYHEAITNIPAPSNDLKGKVIDVAEKGYFHNDVVLRYAKVIVAQ